MNDEIEPATEAPATNAPVEVAGVVTPVEPIAEAPPADPVGEAEVDQVEPVAEKEPEPALDEALDEAPDEAPTAMAPDGDNFTTLGAIALDDSLVYASRGSFVWAMARAAEGRTVKRGAWFGLKAVEFTHPSGRVILENEDFVAQDWHIV